MHGVIKSSSTTTKLRIVFYASAKTSNGVSLNDILLPGPVLHPLITTIINQFRTYNITISADISKMYREIGLHDSEQDLHRFLQFNDHGNSIDMRKLRVAFGLTSSPYLAIQTLHQIAEDYVHQWPTASKTVKKNFYVDDCLTGEATVEEASLLRTQLNQLMSEGQMTLCKWRSSSQAVLDTIPQELKEADEVLTISSHEECSKALGIHRDNASDQLHVPTPQIDVCITATKRGVASAAGSGICSNKDV